MGRVAWFLLLLALMLVPGKTALADAVQGVALTADGVVLAAGAGPVGRAAEVEHADVTYPARVLAADDRLGLVLLKAEAVFNPAMLADDKTLVESKHFCALIVQSGEAHCDKLHLAARSPARQDFLTLLAGEAGYPAVGTPIFSRRAKLVGLVISQTGKTIKVGDARAIRRLVSGVPNVAGRLVPLRSTQVARPGHLALAVSPHLVRVRYGRVAVAKPGADAAPATEPPVRGEAGPVAKARTQAKSGNSPAEPPAGVPSLDWLYAEGARHFHAGRYGEAYRAYRQSAEQGHAKSQVSLGLLCEEGLGVPKDYELAAAWYRKAAEAGELLGYMNLGRMFEQGRGVPEDPFHAAVLYSKAAERGHKPAHQALERLLHKGR